MTIKETLLSVNKIGYPILLLPSYLLGKQNMVITFGNDDIKEYMEIILSQEMKDSILIDKYLMKTELEVDESVMQMIILILAIIKHMNLPTIRWV